MSFKVIVTRDFDHMSESAARIVANDIQTVLGRKSKYVIGLATGNTPTGLYKHFAKAANKGTFDSSRIQSFNLDEYIGLPGENAQQRALHPESYSFYMIQELFGLLKNKFMETNVPWGTLIDQSRFNAELESFIEDWEMQGSEKGKAIVIRKDAQSEYLRWIRREVLDYYEKKIRRIGGIDLQVIGVGGRGHVGFHEAGIPFESNNMLLVKLDENTVENAVADGHFARKEESPLYAVSMGAKMTYSARTVLLLANGSRKAEPVAESLLMEPDCSLPISYSHVLAANGGNVVYVLDNEAALKVMDNIDAVRQRGIVVEDLSDQSASTKVEDLVFSRDPATSLMC